jgi:hypothetical protein
MVVGETSEYEGETRADESVEPGQRLSVLRGLRLGRLDEAADMSVCVCMRRVSEQCLGLGVDVSRAAVQE